VSKEKVRFLTERAALRQPDSFKTRSGIVLLSSAPKWVFRDGTAQVSINFLLLPDKCASLLPGFKKTIIWYLKNRSSETAARYHSDFLWFVRLVVEGETEHIERIVPENIVAIKISSIKAEHRLAALRGFLIKWSEIGAPGIGSDVADLLAKLTLKQYPVGTAVATLHPKKGPLTDLEFEAIQAAINNAYALDEIETTDLMMCYLLMALGVRPSQIASLKCGDLIVPDSPDGDYVLHVPRAKQKGQLARSELKMRKLTHQIGEPLAAYMESIRLMFSDRLKDVSEAPLFPQRNMIENANAPGFQYHSTSSSLSERIVKVFTRLEVPSERLEGSAIPMSPVRFRRTFATRAAEEGWPLLVIAELLDHSNTRNVEVRGGPAQLDRNPVFLSDISAGYAAAASSGWLK
jgi:integrase